MSNERRRLWKNCMEVLLQLALLPPAALITLLSLSPLTLPFCGVIFGAVGGNKLVWILGYAALLLFFAWLPYLYYPRVLCRIKNVPVGQGTPHGAEIIKNVRWACCPFALFFRLASLYLALAAFLVPALTVRFRSKEPPQKRLYAYLLFDLIYA